MGGLFYRSVESLAGDLGVLQFCNCVKVRGGLPAGMAITAPILPNDVASLQAALLKALAELARARKRPMRRRCLRISNYRSPSCGVSIQAARAPSFAVAPVAIWCASMALNSEKPRRNSTLEILTLSGYRIMSRVLPRKLNSTIAI